MFKAFSYVLEPRESPYSSRSQVPIHNPKQSQVLITHEATSNRTHESSEAPGAPSHI